MTEIDHYYPMFMDIHGMIFVGFGFLMTFLNRYTTVVSFSVLQTSSLPPTIIFHRYGFGAVGFNFLLSAFALEWSILTNGFFEKALKEKSFDHPISLSILSLIDADFAAGKLYFSTMTRVYQRVRVFIILPYPIF